MMKLTCGVEIGLTALATYISPTGIVFMIQARSHVIGTSNQVNQAQGSGATGLSITHGCRINLGRLGDTKSSFTYCFTNTYGRHRLGQGFDLLDQRFSNHCLIVLLGNVLLEDGRLLDSRFLVEFAQRVANNVFPGGVLQVGDC